MRPAPVPSGLLLAATGDGGVPLHPGREEARGWAAQELAHREYADARPGLLTRALQWVFQQLDHLKGASDPVSVTLLIALLVAVVATVCWALWRAGGIGRSVSRAASSAAVLPGGPRTAAEHRAEADEHAAHGRWAPAVLERFRAIARELEERAVLAPQPGRTADELARVASVWLPRQAGELRRAADLFDRVCYGRARAHAADDEWLRELDAAVRRARPRPDLPGQSTAEALASAIPAAPR